MIRITRFDAPIDLSRRVILSLRLSLSASVIIQGLMDVRTPASLAYDSIVWLKLATEQTRIMRKVLEIPQKTQETMDIIFLINYLVLENNQL